MGGNSVKFREVDSRFNAVLLIEHVHRNCSCGCSFEAKLGSFEVSALMRPPDFPIVICSPPDMTATGRSRKMRNDDDAEVELLTINSTKYVLFALSWSLKRGTVSVFSDDE
jgi:hypothetical protein